MPIIAKFLSSLICLFLSVMFFLCGGSYYVWMNVPGSGLSVGPGNISLLGIFRIPFYRFDPAGFVRFASERGIQGFNGFEWSIIFHLAVSAFLWLFLQLVAAFALRLLLNKKTTLHGSSRWASDREMKSLGLLSGIGVILGQTKKAKYIEIRKQKPKRKKGESREDYRDRLRLFNPAEKEMKFIREGNVISQRGNAHTLIVGSTRSGKGVSCIIPTEFRWPESLIVLDPKAEGWDISANYRSRFSWTFKFQPEKPDESIHYNPLLSIRRGKLAIPDIQNLAYILIPDKGGKDPFWDNEARKLFAAVVGYVIYCEEPRNKTLAQVYSIFSNSEALQQLKPEEQQDQKGEQMSAVKRYLTLYAGKAKQYIEAGRMPKTVQEVYASRDRMNAADRKKAEEDAKKYLTEDDCGTLRRIQQDLEYFAACEDKQLSSVVSTMLSQLQVIADPNVQAVTDRSDFTMDDFMNGVPDETGNRRPMSMYLCVSLSSMQRLVPLINIFYSQAITLLSQDLDRKRKFRLLLIFDEFYQLGRLDVVEKALSLTAGYGILCMIAIQSFDQLKKLYQSEATFIDNFAYQVVLRVNDEQTSQKIERILGQTTLHDKRTSITEKFNDLAPGSSGTTSSTEVGRALMTSEEIRSMGDNECIIIQSGVHPYKGRKIRYYLDRRFRALYIGKNGKNLPVPILSENLPHSGEKEKDENGKEKPYIGVDGEGWNNLLGADSYQVMDDMKKLDEEKAKLDKAQSEKDEAPDPKNAVATEEKIPEKKAGDDGKPAEVSDITKDARKVLIDKAVFTAFSLFPDEGEDAEMLEYFGSIGLGDEDIAAATERVYQLRSINA